MGGSAVSGQSLPWFLASPSQPPVYPSPPPPTPGNLYFYKTYSWYESSIILFSVQFSSITQLCPTLCDPKDSSTPGLPVHHQLLEPTQTDVHRVGDAIQPSHPLSSPSPPAPNPSQHQSLFQWVSSSHEVAKVLEFQLQHQSFQWTPRTDLLYDGLAGSPCSPKDSQSLQHHSSKASILWCSAFFTVQLSHAYMTTGKAALTRRTFVGQVMSLLFNILSRLVVAFPPRRKCLNSLAAVTICSDFGAPKNKILTVSPSICHEVMGPDGMILVSECWVLSQVFHSPLSLSSRVSLVL